MRKTIWSLFLILLFSCGCATVPLKENKSIQIAENAYSNYKSAAELIVPVDRANYYTFMEVLNIGWRKEDKNLEKLLSDNEPVFKEFKKGLEKEKCSLPIVKSPEECREILYCLDRFRELTRLLTLKIQFQVYKKDYNKAIQDCLDIIRFGQHLEKGGNSFSKRIGMAIQNNGYKNLRDVVFQTKRLNYSRLLENIQSFKNNIKTREHFGEILKRELSDIKFNVSPLLLSEIDWGGVKESYQASGYTQEEVIKSIKVCYLDAIGYIDLSYNGGLTAWKLPQIPQNPIRQILMPILRNMYIECGRLDTERDATFIIVGLEYYYNKNNKYPEKLSSLVPKYLPSLLNDPFTGESFVYQRMGKGWRMYSIGSDLKNDFGQKHSYLSEDGTGDIIFYKE